jgi:hypothetical protein
MPQSVRAYKSRSPPAWWPFVSLAAPEARVGRIDMLFTFHPFSANIHAKIKGETMVRYKHHVPVCKGDKPVGVCRI